MENLVWLVPVIGCGLMMLVMMLMMGMGMGMIGRGKDKGGSKDEPAERTVGELRAEKDRLESEIARREGAESGAGDARPSAARHA